MYYTQIRDRCYLVMQEMPKLAKVRTPTPTHHILLLDRSGSMTWTIHPLIDQVIERVRSFKKDDTVTVGYFSGLGEFRFPLKGFRIGGVYTLDVLCAVCDTMRSTLSTTCFSEILGDLDLVTHELAPLGSLFALTLFTDGCPVVPDVVKEEQRIFQAIAAVKARLAHVLLVGYGGYYNRNLMSRMAEAFGGSLVHANDLETFKVQYKAFTEQESAPKVRVSVREGLLSSPVSLQGRQIVTHTVEKDAGGLFVEATPPGYVYFLVDHLSHLDTRSKPLSFNKDHADIGTVARVEALTQGAYALACVLSQQARTADALELLSALGDVALIDQVSNAFTVLEYGVAEKHLAQCVKFPSRRFTAGRNTTYLPKADAFCVLDALDVLMADEHAYFYPRHPDFHYTRIGRAQVPAEGYPTFDAYEDTACPFTTLTWHKELLNLSVLAKITGTVDLGSDAEKYGFLQHYPTWVWRNYALIKDGLLHVTHLPVTASVGTLDTLCTAGLSSSVTSLGRLSHSVTLDLSSLPVMNRAMAEGHTSAAALCLLVEQELACMATLKVLRWQQECEEATKPPTRIVLSDAQQSFLASRGITANGFRPPVVTQPTTDFYYAKSFNVSVKGLSSLPSVERVQAKRDSSGKMGTAEQFMVTHWPTEPFSQNVLQEYTARLCTLRAQIQRIKFAVLLGQRWFDEFRDRQDTSLTVNGLEFSLSLRDDVRVEL